MTSGSYRIGDPNPLAVGSPWTYNTTEWVYGTDATKGGVLQQIQNGNADPRKAMLTGLSATPNDIYARVRIDSSLLTDGQGDFAGEYARAGVGLDTDPATGRGYNLVFTGRWYNIDADHPVHLEFLNDGVAWSGWLISGSQTTVAYAKADAPKLGDWYWFHMAVSNGELYGNVWKDPDPGSLSPTGEPAGWTIIYNPADQGAQSQWNRTSGVAALTGSSTGQFTGEPPSGAAVSFDDVTVRTGVTVPTTVMTTASASSAAVALTPIGALGAGLVDDTCLTDLARELLRPQRKH
jgi:hypothetical protein